MLKNIDVRKVIELNITDLTDDRTLVRARWKGPKSVEELTCAVVKNEALSLLDSLQSPKDLRGLTDSISIGTYDNGKSQIIARPIIIYCDPQDAYRCMVSYTPEEKALHFNYHLDFEKEPEPGYRIIYFSGHQNTVHDLDGRLLNEIYTDSILNENFDLWAIIKDEAELSEFLEIIPEDTGYGRKTYYVPGNGETMGIRLKMTTDEYQEFVLGERNWATTKHFFRHRLGEEAEKYIRADDYRERDYD